MGVCSAPETDYDRILSKAKAPAVSSSAGLSVSTLCTTRRKTYMDSSKFLEILEMPMKNASEKYPLATLIILCASVVLFISVWRLPEIISALALWR